MSGEMSLLVTGLLLGLSAGISPGPLFALVISGTLMGGIKEGLKIATAPLFTDIPVLLLGLFVVSEFSKAGFLIGIMSILGSLVLGYFTYGSISFREVEVKSDKPVSFGKALLVNSLNPHMYVAVFTIHSPLMLKAFQTSKVAPYLYFIGFLATLVGSKMALALMAHKSKNFMKSKYYVYTIRALGIMLLVLAISFFSNGLKYLKII
jgi:threonine/homoserine/homoserine lactone efflux protein